MQIKVNKINRINISMNELITFILCIPNYIKKGSDVKGFILYYVCKCTRRLLKVGVTIKNVGLEIR